MYFDYIITFIISFFIILLSWYIIFEFHLKKNLLIIEIFNLNKK
jgi:hypothetical protein